MKLSIIIPVYNVEEYVSCTIDSCLDQDIDKSEYEIICVNDGSTDHSLEILEKYTDIPNVRIITQINSGVSVARNRGIQEAKGDYLWFIDSDDFIIKNCIPQILGWIDEHPETDMIQWKLKRTTDENDRFAEESIIVSNSFKSGQELLEFLPKEQQGFSWSYWVKRSVVQENDVEFPPKVIMCEDECFNFYLRKYVKACSFISTPIYCYRTRESSVTNNIHKRNSIKRYVDSRIELATYNTKKLFDPKNLPFQNEIKKRILYDVQGAISMALSMGELSYTKSVLQNLKNKGLYPYKIPFAKLLPHGNLRKYFIDILAVLYPCKFFVYCYCILYKVTHGLKNHN